MPDDVIHNGSLAPLPLSQAGYASARAAKPRRLFGTDGIRGTSNSEPITPETALRVAMCAGRVFTRGEHRHVVVIGKDTRLSGYMLEPALTAGFVAMGMDVLLTGPIPTPAVAILTRSMRADLGVVISASHNSFEDNGIKLFGPDGFKLSDAAESEIEALVQTGGFSRAQPPNLGQVARLGDAVGRYIEFVKATVPRDFRLDGLRIVVDCANGAAYRTAPAVLRELGAEIIPINVDPDGLNINHECGATAPRRLCQEVRDRGADLGVAFDGDADRLIVCDEQGEILDGDQILAVIATDWQRRGRLSGPGVVATVMSNLGLERYLASLGIELIRTKVGDRYVLEAMRERGCNLGGEQSGHIILGDYATTGDGLIAAVQLLAAVLPSGRPLSAVGRTFQRVPQVLKNIRFSGESPLESRVVREEIEKANQRLGNGRLLVRPSGTEPVIRIMAESEDVEAVEAIVEDVCRCLAIGTVPPRPAPVEFGATPQ